MGPTNAHLYRIEAQRKLDTELARTSKAANALVVYAKKGRTRGGIPPVGLQRHPAFPPYSSCFQHLTKAAQLLVREVRNSWRVVLSLEQFRNPVSDGNGGILEGAPLPTMVSTLP